MTVRDAATVMILRDAPTLEVFMLRRSPDTVFAGGAYVFPGGAVDPHDAAPAVATRIDGLDDAAASRALALPGGGLAVWTAAIRETFEESGLLLAEPRSGRSPDRARLEEHRRALNSGETSWPDILDAEDLVMRGSELRVVAHFLTPPGAPRRYDTWFFAAPAPEGQHGVHDNGEAVDSAWIRPGEALEMGARDEIELIAPTIFTLRWLARFDTADEVLDAADRATSGGGSPPLVVSEGLGERIALDETERSNAAPGWMPLSPLMAGLEREGVA